MHSKYFFSALLCCLAFQVNFCQSPFPGINRNQAAGFTYFEMVKKGNQANDKLPVLLAFHYSAGTPAETFGYFDSIDIPVRILVLQGNHNKRGGFSYFPIDYYTRDSLAQALSARKTLDSIAAFLVEINKKYNIKPVVSGISQGGDISFLLAIHYPGLIRSSFPIAGFVHRHIYEGFKKVSKKGVPVYVFQGEKDPIVALDYTRGEVKTLQGFLKISLLTYPRLGHDISPELKSDLSFLLTKELMGRNRNK